MESLENISARISNSVQEEKSSVPALAPRIVPMNTDDIEKMHKAVERFFVVMTVQNYGYIPVMDGDHVVKQDYDVISESTTLKIRDDISVPQSMWDAMMRPVFRSHVIYHLGRLAAHRHYAKGQQMLMALIEDISFDLKDISEWAVIMACAEMRRKRDTWYPSSQEILDVIERNDATIKGAFNKRLEAPKPKKSKFDQANFYKDPRDNPLRRTLCDFLVTHGMEDFFDSIVMYSNYQLRILASHKGWKHADHDHQDD